MTLELAFESIERSKSARIDDAHRAKYRGSSYLDPMPAHERATFLPELPPLFAGTQFTISEHFPPVHDFGTDLIGASHWNLWGATLFAVHE